MLDILIIVIVISSIVSMVGGSKNKNSQRNQNRERRYEKADQSPGDYNRNDGLSESWSELRRRIEEAAGVSGQPAKQRSMQSQGSGNRPRSPRQRGGSSPQHRRITAEHSRAGGGQQRERVRSGNTLMTRKAEIAESVAYWEENRAHMRAINDEFNEFIARQHADQSRATKEYSVSHSRRR